MSLLTIFMTGEGPSDIGTLKQPEGEFVPGAMAHVAKAVAEMYAGKLTFDCRFTSEGELSRIVKNQKSFKRQSVIEGRGQKTKEFAGFWFRARAFAKEVCEAADPKPEYAMAILFSDTDGTHSASPQRWLQKYEAISNGFVAGGCEYGVPMVPRPKSEAWLIAYYQKNFGEGHSAYQNCTRFECLAGNDDSKPANSAKHILDKLLDGERPDPAELYKIDWSKVDMPSFVRFKERVKEVLSSFKE